MCFKVVEYRVQSREEICLLYLVLMLLIEEDDLIKEKEERGKKEVSLREQSGLSLCQWTSPTTEG